MELRCRLQTHRGTANFSLQPTAKVIETLADQRLAVDIRALTQADEIARAQRPPQLCWRHAGADGVVPAKRLGHVEAHATTVAALDNPALALSTALHRCSNQSEGLYKADPWSEHR